MSERPRDRRREGGGRGVFFERIERKRERKRGEEMDFEKRGGEEVAERAAARARRTIFDE